MNALCRVAQMLLSEWRHQLLFDLGRTRKCAPVMHTGETLVIFSLTDSDREANAITERHGGAERLLPLPSEPDTQRGLSSPITEFTFSHIHESASERKLI